MRSIAIAALLATASAVKLSWPSVARCAPGQISTDFHPCDDNSKGPHHLDGTQVQLDAEWPSVARCAPGQISTDETACDDNSKGPHHIDGTLVEIDSSDVVLFGIDGTRLQIAENWPSVARCNPG